MTHNQRENMNKWILITGASKGIGLDLAWKFAKEKNNLVLVARNEDLLIKIKEKLTTKYNVSVEIIPQDLSQHDSAEKIKAEIDQKNINIHTLVNNAGIGIAGKFHEHSLTSTITMLNLNLITLTKLCRLFIPVMVKNSEGAILNVSSTAAFQGGPYMSVYYASKAFVLSFSEGLYHELRDQNIIVSCLCPGPTKTDFFKGEGLNNNILESMPWVKSSKKVANVGYSGLMKKKTIIIPGILNWIGVQLACLVPRSFSRNIAAKLNHNPQESANQKNSGQ